MADVHRLRSGLSRNDLDLISQSIGEVAGSLGMLAMMATRIDDDEMVLHPRDLYGMMETLRSELVRANQQLRTAL